MIKTTRTTSRTWLALAISASALLAACGGGGASGGTSSGTSSNTIALAQLSVSAGQTLAMSSRATFHAAAPSGMAWAISYNGNAPGTPGTGGSGIPSFSDAKCATATYQAPAFSTSLGIGSCNTVLSVPANTPAGVWRISNTATAAAGTVTDFVDITVMPEPTGFAMVSSSTPANATSGQTVPLSLPYTAATGAVVSNVQYTWTEAAGNPAKSSIVGAGNAVASVITPATPGAYTYNATVSALVNGVAASSSGSVVVNVATTTSTAETVSAGDVQVLTIADSGTVIKLTGSILKFDATANYSYQWTQLNPSGSLPTLALANANSSSASLSAPNVAGTYAFRLTVTKTVNGAVVATLSAETSIVVQATQTPVFTVSAGNAQTVTLGNVATLTGTVTPQNVSTATTNAITYSYQWTQVGATPASVVLSNANTRTASFVASAAGTYQFTLAVTATNGASSSTVYATTQVIVVGAAVKGFTVSASNTQTVKIATATSMAGTVTTQGDYTGAVFTYQWTQTAGPAVTVANATALTASFVPSTAGTYQFTLAVTATTGASSSTVSATTQVIVLDAAGKGFSVSASNTQTVKVTTATAMAGTVTTQGDYTGAVFTYLWTQTAGPVVTVANATAATASVVPTVAGTYTFQLDVTCVQNGVTSTGTAQTQVLVTP